MAFSQPILNPAIHPLPDKRLVGGKGYALWKLYIGQFPVPHFIVISADVFNSLKKQNNRYELSDELLIDIQETLKKQFPTTVLFSVRSSAAAEDGSTFSFAGQFKSVLNVQLSTLKSAIEEVWNSAESEQVLSYVINQPGQTKLEMAIVIQIMIDSHISGVGFAIDPVSGARGNQRISAVAGLGEKLVSGEVDAYEYVVYKNGSIGSIFPKSEHELLNDEPQLGDSLNIDLVPREQVLEISALIKNATDYFGTYQDIEWTIANSKLYILQSRPITNFAHLPDNSDELILWDNSNITESYPGMTSPLTFSFIEDIYREVYQQFCRVLGVEEELIQDNKEYFSMLGYLNYRVYYRLNNWYQVLSLLPGYEINAAFMEQMMGVKEKVEVKIKTHPSKKNKYLRLVKTISSLVWQWIRIESSIKKFYSRFQLALDSVPDDLISKQSPSELKKMYFSLEKQLITKWDAPLVNDFFAMIAFGLFIKQLEKLDFEHPKSIANLLLMSQGGIISTAPTDYLHRIVDKINSDKSVSHLFSQSSSDENCVNLLLQSPAVNKEFLDYLSTFGNRWAEELKLETITPAQDPKVLIPLIRAYSKSKTYVTSLESMDEKSEILNVINKKFGRNWVKKTIFNLMMNQAKNRVRDRENLRFERTRLFAKIRTIFLSYGNYLYRNNLLSSPRDIFYFTKEELFRMSDGTSPDQQFQAIADKRKKEWKEKIYSTIPDRIKTVGIPIAFDQLKPEEKILFEGDISGLGCSKGIVKAKIKIVHSPTDIEGLSGCIMVAEKTDPGWTPLFPLAKGLIIERGSLLSHAAIVSREMGIPAIVSVKHALDIFKDDMWVEMDGATGQIKILTEDETYE